MDDKIIKEDNHIKAGLVYSGVNAEGEKEWIGTTAEWREYEKLEKEEENDFSGATYLEGTENSGQER